jgi:hypothetical protein
MSFASATAAIHILRWFILIMNDGCAPVIVDTVRIDMNKTNVHMDTYTYLYVYIYMYIYIYYIINICGRRWSNFVFCVCVGGSGSYYRSILIWVHLAHGALAMFPGWALTPRPCQWLALGPPISLQHGQQLICQIAFHAYCAPASGPTRRPSTQLLSVMLHCQICVSLEGNSELSLVIWISSVTSSMLHPPLPSCW